MDISIPSNISFPNIHAENDYAVFMACAKGHLNVAKYLVCVGANIHANGDSTIQCARQSGHHDVVEYIESLRHQSTTQKYISQIMYNTQ